MQFRSFKLKPMSRWPNEKFSASYRYSLIKFLHKNIIWSCRLMRASWFLIQPSPFTLFISSSGIQYLDAFLDQIKMEVQRVRNSGYQRDGSSNVSRKGTPKNSSVKSFEVSLSGRLGPWTVFEWQGGDLLERGNEANIGVLWWQPILGFCHK